MPSPSPVLRTARVSDAPAVAVVHVETWRAAYRGLLPDDFLAGISLERRTAAWQEWLGGGAGDVGDVDIAEHDGDVVGFVWVGAARDDDADARTGELLAIYVLPQHWGDGTGTALHATGMTRLADRGYRRATLWVLDGNARAQRFYEREGWAADGKRRVEQRGDLVLHEVRLARDI